MPGYALAEVSPELQRVYTLSIQEELARRGLYGGPLYGQVGSETRYAIRSYQQRQALPADGAPSHGLLNHLKFVDPVSAGAAPEAAQSATRQSPVGTPLPLLPATAVDQPPAPQHLQPEAEIITVEDVQWALWEQGYYQGAIDGIPGPKTEQAIRDYQRDAGLPITGKIDSKITGKTTWVNPESQPSNGADQSITWNN